MPEFYQIHDTGGYRAKVTIEWSAPDGVELLPDRAGEAEAIAGDALAKIAAAAYEIVQVMLGRKAPTR